MQIQSGPQHFVLCNEVSAKGGSTVVYFWLCQTVQCMSRKGETGTAAGLGYRLAPGGPIFSFIAQMSLKTLARASVLPMKAVWDLNWCLWCIVGRA